MDREHKVLFLSFYGGAVEVEHKIVVIRSCYSFLFYLQILSLIHVEKFEPG